MPRAKIDPLEAKKQTVRTKLLFIALIAALVGVTSLLMTLKSEKKGTEAPQHIAESKTESNGDILGTSSTSGKELVSKVKDEAEVVANEAISSADTFVNDTREKINESFTDIVYTTAIKPILDHIDSLPSEQQDSIKDALCRTPDGP